MKAVNVAFALSIATQAAAVPFTKPKIGTSQIIRVPAIHNPKPIRSGPAALRKAYLKYGLPVPKTLNRIVKLEKRQALVDAHPQTDESEWLCPVTVGKTEMMLDFDTGSADLWVFSDQIKEHGSHAAYPCAARHGGGGSGDTPTPSPSPSPTPEPTPTPPPSSGGGLEGLLTCFLSCLKGNTGDDDLNGILKCRASCVSEAFGNGGSTHHDSDEDDEWDITDPFSGKLKKRDDILSEIESLPKRKRTQFDALLKLAGLTMEDVKKSVSTSSPSPSHSISQLDLGGNRFSNYTWSISYGDGSSASGNVANDTVTVGGVSVRDHAVECASIASPEFVVSPNDGLLGLSFGSISTVKNGKDEDSPQPTWFEAAVEQKVIPKGLFVADLRHKETGSYVFGGMPRGVSEDSAQWVKVQPETGFWQYSSKGIRVNGKEISDPAKNGAIADTGTTLLLMGNSSCAGYYETVEGARDDPRVGGWIFPCKAELPDVEVSVGDKYINVPGDLMNYAPITEGSDTCYGGLQSLEDALGWQAPMVPFIMGDILLKAIYAIFDKDNSRFGWIQKDHIKK